MANDICRSAVIDNKELKYTNITYIIYNIIIIFAESAKKTRLLSFVMLNNNFDNNRLNDNGRTVCVLYLIEVYP